MPRLDYPLCLALLAVAVAAAGQEPVPVAMVGPAEMPNEVEPENLPLEFGSVNSYPSVQCEDWSCCNQWWCKTWYARVELLTLARNHNAQDVVLIQTNAAVPVSSSDDIGFGLAPGISTLVGH